VPGFEKRRKEGEEPERPADEEIPVAEQLHLDAGGEYVAVGVVVKCDFLSSQ
jgi:hypothetical protein